MPLQVYPSSMTDLDVRPVARQFSEMGSAGDWQLFNNAGAGIAQSFIIPTLVDGDRLGVFYTDTGTTATGWSGIGHNITDSVVFGTREHRLVAIVKIPILSTAAETFQVVVGYWDRRNTVAPTDGVWFSYTNGTFAGNWGAEILSNAVGTGAVDTGVLATTSWTRFEILVSASGDSQFYINGTLVATIKGAPSGTARATQVTVMIKKSNGTLVRAIHVDSLLLEMHANR